MHYFFSLKVKKMATATKPTTAPARKSKVRENVLLSTLRERSIRQLDSRQSIGHICRFSCGLAG